MNCDERQQGTNRLVGVVARRQRRWRVQFISRKRGKAGVDAFDRLVPAGHERLPRQRLNRVLQRWRSPGVTPEPFLPHHWLLAKRWQDVIINANEMPEHPIQAIPCGLWLAEAFLVTD